MTTTRVVCNTRKKLSTLLLFATLLFVFLCGPLYLTEHLLSTKDKESVPSSRLYPVRFIHIEDMLNEHEVLNSKTPEFLVAVDDHGGEIGVSPYKRSRKGHDPIRGAHEEGAIRFERVDYAPTIQRGLVDGADNDPVARERRNKVKEVSYDVAI